VSDERRPGGYLLVAACYQAFTLSDGALRMLVLLHLHARGQTAWALALVLLPYELAGVVTNLFGGFLGARFGLKLTLVTGLVLQVAACAMLTVSPALLTVPYVMASQVLSGVAKDLAKTSAKSYVRALAPQHSPVGLFRLVAVMTGSKNATKGLGFFAGGALLAAAGFRWTNVGLAALLAVAAIAAARLLPPMAGRRSAKLVKVLAHDASVNWLSTARLFLFGSRDAWFAIALPLFLVGDGWSPAGVGTFLAVWVVGYGVVQAAAPALVHPTGVRSGVVLTTVYSASLVLPLAATAWSVHRDVAPLASLVVGLCVYGALFAITSSLHSWLIVALAGGDDVPERVGFYYAANATGRLAGMLVSGALFAAAATPAHGLVACLALSVVAVVLAAVLTLPIRRLVPR
jgi:MFS family permease